MLLEAVRELQAGTSVTFTPDGPRGPRRVFKPGAALAAQHAGVPLVPVRATPLQAWRLRSWDRFAIPKPGALVRVAYGDPIRGGAWIGGRFGSLRSGRAGIEPAWSSCVIGGRRGDTHRFLRWLWTSRRPEARLARIPLIPASALWRAGMKLRESAYRRGWATTHDLPLPTVSVGNLTVGGSGKTPIAIWIARHYAAQGLRPGILLRGYGGDETLVHRRSVPEAIVVANADRVAGAEAALAQGAQVLVLDDAYQRLDVRRDLNLAVVAAETTRAVRWAVPAGPWREGVEALDRADALIITRKRATPEAAETLADELSGRVAGPVAIAHLGLRHLEDSCRAAGSPRANYRGAG